MSIPKLAHRFMANDQNPPLAGEFRETTQDYTGYQVRFDLQRPTTLLTITVSMVGSGFVIPWSAGDLVAGDDQLATLRLIDTGQRSQLLAQFAIDVAPEPI